MDGANKNMETTHYILLAIMCSQTVACILMVCRCIVAETKVRQAAKLLGKLVPQVSAQLEQLWALDKCKNN
jgi:hypothetical protein